MSPASWWLIVVVALLHVGFMCAEMFFWVPFSQAVAGPEATTAANAKALAFSKALGFNQGLYNGFLAVGLAWSLRAPAAFNKQLAIFFLGCVVAAGVVGGVTISYGILLLQAMPAAVALLLVWKDMSKLPTP